MSTLFYGLLPCIAMAGYFRGEAEMGNAGCRLMFFAISCVAVWLGNSKFSVSPAATSAATPTPHTSPSLSPTEEYRLMESGHLHALSEPAAIAGRSSAIDTGDVDLFREHQRSRNLRSRTTNLGFPSVSPAKYEKFSEALFQQRLSASVLPFSGSRKDGDTLLVATMLPRQCFEVASAIVYGHEYLYVFDWCASTVVFKKDVGDLNWGPGKDANFESRFETPSSFCPYVAAIRCGTQSGYTVSFEEDALGGEKVGLLEYVAGKVATADFLEDAAGIIISEHVNSSAPKIGWSVLEVSQAFTFPSCSDFSAAAGNAMYTYTAVAGAGPQSELSAATAELVGNPRFKCRAGDATKWVDLLMNPDDTTAPARSWMASLRASSPPNNGARRRNRIVTALP